jgi:hypothetical protein
VHPDVPAPGREEKEKAFEAVLKSRTFSRSDQLQGFLRYICELELAGRGHEITEYSIATEALNRPSDYAPGEDSSVRSRAHSLRRKLQEFYESEAPDAEWRIDLPKGSYRPLFVSRNRLPLVLGPSLAPQVAPKRRSSPAIRFWGVALLFAAVAGIGVTLVFTWLRTDRIDPIVHQAWGPVLGKASDILIVVGCPPLVRTSISGQGATKSAPLVAAPPEIASWYDSQNLEARNGPLYILPSRGYALFADTLAATHATSLLTAAGASFQVVPEPVVQLMAVHERGMIVIGPPAYTGVAMRMLRGTPFSVHYDRSLNDEVIGDGRAAFAPKRGAGNRFSTVYGLITVLPSQPGRSRPERTLLFSGITGSPGAQAALQYFTSPNALRDLQARFRQQGHATFPAAYQVVVRCGVDREASINSVYETHRIMASTPVIE